MIQIRNHCYIASNTNITVIGISTGSYPFGGATTIRNLSLFKGLKELNYAVQLLSVYPDKNQNTESSLKKGIYNGVPYSYTYSSIYNKYKVIRLISFFIGVISCIIKVLNIKSVSRTIIINYIKVPFLSFITTVIFRLFKIPVFHEVTEYPFVRINSKPFSNYFYLHFTIRLYNKLFVISNALKEYFSSYINKDKIEVINMIVNPSPFELKTENIFNFEYIAYCGSMNTDKDGVPILIEAFSIIKEHYPKLKLILIGDIKNRPVHSSIIKTINDNNLQDRIHFTGYIKNNELPHYLKNAKLLALARPNNIQAKGGFPTKLGEYLATGIPVIVTNVGEIPLFLKNQENAYISNPNSEDFAKQIITALNDYDNALIIGKNGKKLVQKEFNYYEEAKKIDQEIIRLYNSN